MLRDLRLSDTKPFDEVVHRELPVCEGVQDLAPARFADRVEHVRCGSRSSHGRNIYPYRYMSRPPLSLSVQTVYEPMTGNENFLPQRTQSTQRPRTGRIVASVRRRTKTKCNHGRTAER